MTWRSILIALQFLTRVPTPNLGTVHQRETGGALVVYPIVGLLIGCCVAFPLWAFPQWPATVQALVILTIWLFLTGLLHIDGLADSADAWLGGYGDRGRSLAIMQDPASGPAGVIAIVIVVLTKFLALTLLLENDHWWPLLWIPVLGRSAAQFTVVSTPYARETGLGRALAEFAPHSWVILSITLSWLMCAAFIGFVTTLCGVVAMLLLRRMMVRRLEGFTGDTLGAAIEIVEATALLALAVTLSN